MLRYSTISQRNKHFCFALHSRFSITMNPKTMISAVKLMSRSVLSLFKRMASTSKIPQVADVDIDAKGVFKYILIKVTSPNANGEIEDKLIVRGYAECPYHADINDKVTSELQKLKMEKTIRDWRTKVLGGGRIEHDPDGKLIKVYGYSQGYGKADHEVAVNILKTKYNDYNVTWTNEGY